MKRLYLGTVALVYLSFGCIAQEQDIEYPFIGHWVFNKHETIKNFKNSQMTVAEVKEFSSILKPADIVITEKDYSTFLEGRKPTKTPYSLVSISENGECFKLQFEDQRIPLDIQINKVCVTNGKLLLSSVKGSKEVFDRKL